MLCFRCEYRAAFLEGGGRHRYECGTDYAVHSCYMFKPTKPLILAKDENDPRPQFGPAMISARSNSQGVTDSLHLESKKYDKGTVLYWVPD